MKESIKEAMRPALMIVVVVFVLLSAPFLMQKYRGVISIQSQNIERKVFENTNSFTKGKRQDAIKYYKEWLQTENTNDKKAIENIVALSFADFDENEYIVNRNLRNWIKKCKY